jgi:hypothetical protein
MSSVYPKHDDDLYGWAIHTAELLRSKKMNEVDFDNIIEEMDALGRSEKHELTNRLSLLMAHLLKWQYQPQHRSRSWILTLEEQRIQVEIHFKDNPGLKGSLTEILETAYKIAKIKAEKETSLDKKTFPQVCPYTLEEIMDEQFYPDSTDNKKS